MMDQIYNSDDMDPCKQILAIVSRVYQPITIIEFTSFIDLPEDMSNDHKSLAEIVGLCASFLTLQGYTNYHLLCLSVSKGLFTCQAI